MSQRVGIHIMKTSDHANEYFNGLFWLVLTLCFIGTMAVNYEDKDAKTLPVTSKATPLDPFEGVTVLC